MKLVKSKYSLECKLIARLIFEGYTKEEIGKILNYSTSTITSRMDKIFRKYNVTTRHEFITAVFSKHIYELKDKNIVYKDLIKNFIKFFEELNISLKNKKLAQLIVEAKELIEN